MAETKEGEFVVVNRGKRQYALADGRVLHPGKSIRVSGKEAKLLLSMRDCVDSKKMAEPEEAPPAPATQPVAKAKSKAKAKEPVQA